MPETKVAKEKPELLNDIDALEKIVEDLNNQVSDLNKRRVALESTLASTRYQADNERGEVIQKANVERQEKLAKVIDFENSLKVRQRKIEEEELRLSELRKQVEKDQLRVGDIAVQFSKMDRERVQIEQMRFEAKRMMDEALTRKAEADNAFQEYRNAVLDLERQRKDIENKNKEADRVWGEAQAAKSALEPRIVYYEELVEFVKTNMKVEKKEEK